MLEVKKSNNSKGMTYIEVAVCLFAIAIVITPLCMTMITATKTRVGAESIRESTYNAESLMADIKLQMTSDMNLKIRKEGKKLTSTEESNLIEINERIRYLSVTSGGIEIDLKDFLKPLDSDTKYNTTKYAYEIAIWKDEDLPIVVSADLEFDMKNTTLLDAIRISSTTEENLSFDSYNSDKVVSIKVKKELAQVLKDKLYIDRFIPSNIASSTPANYEIIDVRTIAFYKNDLGVISPISTPSALGALLINTRPIKEWNNIVKGYTFEIDISSGYLPKDATLPLYGNIILDLRPLLRDFTEEGAFKFINKTDHLMNIKILRNVKEGTTETLNKIDEKIDTQFSIIAENETSLGKINIERIDDKILQNNYIIAIIIREKDPSLGERGKIVKKMVDVYSYTPPKG